MKWVEDIKTGIGNRTLKNWLEDHSRKMQPCNLNDARSIGVVYDATQPVSFEIIKEFVRKLSEKAEKISILGYVDSKNIQDQLLYRKGFDLISRKDLNWFYKPNAPVAEKFMNEPFDILLNLSLADHFPIRYIVTMSKAAFKAGRFTTSDESLDFMIDIEREKASMNKARQDMLREAGIRVQSNATDDEADQLTDTEVQLQFLISQLMHYLSIFNK
jgi:hypothetical protein